MNAAFSSHNVTGFKGYLSRSPSSYPVRVVWNDNEAEIIYMLSTRGAKRGSNYIYFRFPFLYLWYPKGNTRGAFTLRVSCTIYTQSLESV